MLQVTVKFNIPSQWGTSVIQYTGKTLHKRQGERKFMSKEKQQEREKCKNKLRFMWIEHMTFR